MICVDWGTSNLRAALAGTAVQNGLEKPWGLMQARQTGFGEILSRLAEELSAPDNAPAVICGMAGARSGWREAAYLTCPADGAALAAHALRFEDNARQVAILPGLRCTSSDGTPDIMRGEETQIAGLKIEAAAQICLPGTHSKWVDVEGGQITCFSTAMTGEVFAAISGHTILADTLGPDPNSDEAFAAGLRAGASGRLLTAAFSLRARSIAGGEGRMGLDHLSGLLIGTELASVKPKNTVHLAGSDALLSRYKRAMQILHPGVALILHDGAAAAMAGLERCARQIFPERFA